MAKNISLLGADYPDVPAVQLPQTGGGTATFYDIQVIDNLNSDSSTDALSAKQGKELNINKANKSEKIIISNNITSSATLAYTGISFSIPAGKEFGVFVRASYTNNEPLEIALSTSNTNLYSYNTYARSNTCNTVSVSGTTDTNTIGAITLYVWAKYSGAGTNKIVVSGYYRDI